MSITDELREFAPHLDLGKVALAGWKEGLLAIADHIDAEHQKAIRELNNFADASVLLPVDADGMPIRIGDVIAYKDNTKPKKVVALVPPYVVMVDDGPRYADMCRHYHTPTVEDVLWELLGKITPLMEDDEAVPIVKAYAEKLCLADDGEGQ